MPDDMDHAQARAEEYTADALREHWRHQKLGVGLSHCEECGEPIPEARRRAQPTATHCVDCQAALEVNQRRIT
ncbi:MAG: TraR/DksA family transcriptional regulator [Trichlorobacter sp.]|uniref:TraR/DksA family transcriptional regulator n=1 Tax=Trichlorobacter sp. TaxID=2911007 RepID=UPI002561C3A1|nr:TraR/DksA family transcriptional regulator [Trichlorobacter sp.]